MDLFQRDVRWAQPLAATGFMVVGAGGVVRRAGLELARLESPAGWACLSPDERTLAAFDQGALRFFQNDHLIFKVPAPVDGAVFLTNTRVVMTKNGFLELWDHFQLERRWPGAGALVASASYFAVLGATSLDVYSHEGILILKRPVRASCAAFAGQELLFTHGRVLEAWHVARGAKLRADVYFDDDIRELSVETDLAAVAFDARTKLFYFRTGKLVSEFPHKLWGLTLRRGTLYAMRGSRFYEF